MYRQNLAANLENPINFKLINSTKKWRGSNIKRGDNKKIFVCDKNLPEYCTIITLGFVCEADLRKKNYWLSFAAVSLDKKGWS